MQFTTVPPAEPFMPPELACVYLRQTWGIRRSVPSLSTYRCRGGGPAFKKAGRSVLYARHDLDAWADQLLSGATEHGGKAAQAMLGEDQIAGTALGGRPPGRGPRTPKRR